MAGCWRRCVLYAACLLASLPLAAELEVALILMGQTHSYWQALQRGAEDAARSHNDTLTYATIMESCAGSHSDPSGAYYDLGKAQLKINCSISPILEKWVTRMIAASRQ